MDPRSPIVCDIPDCATTKSEIDAELRAFLCGFCSICKRDRAGQLCGCAFPCSLTFRAKMMAQIYALLGMAKPRGQRAIQVCFKHPDLIKQAREACVSRRDDRRQSVANFYGGFASMEKRNERTEVKKHSNEEIKDNKRSARLEFQRDEGEEDNSESESESHQASENGSSNIVEEISYLSELSDSSEEDEWEEEFIATDSISNKVLKIQYENYDSRILGVEMKALVNQDHLHDVVFVCRNGRRICGNSLLLASFSPFLARVLQDVPLVDYMKTVILPEVDAQVLELFFLLLFNNNGIKLLHSKQIHKLQRLAKVLGIALLHENIENKVSKLKAPSCNKSTENNAGNDDKDTHKNYKRKSKQEKIPSNESAKQGDENTLSTEPSDGDSDQDGEIDLILYSTKACKKRKVNDTNEEKIVTKSNEFMQL